MILIVSQVQFIIIFVHTVQIQFQPNCNFPKSIGLLLTVNAGLFIYMFGSFYLKSYRKTNKKIVEEVNHNNITDSNTCYEKMKLDDSRMLCEEKKCS